jgi:tryptophan 2,3-dioxygenase
MPVPYKPLYYRDYLQLPAILNAQTLRSEEYADEQHIDTPTSASLPTELLAELPADQTERGAHDELLFIITHQTYELWFKQMLFELDSILTLLAQSPLPEPDVATALHRLQRINKIARLLVQQVDVLETMTPMDFLDFRGVLYPASGFQSLQFRLLEIKLGLSPDRRVAVHLQLDRADTQSMERALAEPSLFVLVERWLERMPFLQYQRTHAQNEHGYAFWEEYKQAVAAMFAHDRAMLGANLADNATAQPFAFHLLAQMEASEQSFQAFFQPEQYQELLDKGARRLSFTATQAALFIFLYREYPLLQLPFRFLEALIELDEVFTLWRHRHAQMAFRMIGSRVGTGGSSGHEYLSQAAAKHRVFTDFSVLSAFLIPRHSLPTLPNNVAERLGFSIETPSTNTTHE